MRREAELILFTPHPDHTPYMSYTHVLHTHVLHTHVLHTCALGNVRCGRLRSGGGGRLLRLAMPEKGMNSLHN